MPNKKIQGSLSGIVDKMNKAYDGLIGAGFSPGIGKRIVPVMAEEEVTGWKMQRLKDGVWVDMDEKPFDTMEELIACYKGENQGGD